MSGDSKKSSRSEGDDQFSEPLLELTGISKPGWFEQAVNSGLNVIGSVTGKKKVTPPPVAVPFDLDQDENKAKPLNTYKPTWNGDNFNPHIEHTNFTTAIGEYNKQQTEMPRHRVAHPLIIRRPSNGMPFIYKFTIFLVVVMFAGGTVIYLDKKYNIRKLVRELKDPGKVKLKPKVRKPVLDD